MYRNLYENIIAEHAPVFPTLPRAAWRALHAVALSLAGTQDSAVMNICYAHAGATVGCASGVRITLGSNQYACVSLLASTGGFTAAESIPSVMTVTYLQLMVQSNHTYQLRARNGRTIMKKKARQGD